MLPHRLVNRIFDMENEKASEKKKRQELVWESAGLECK